MLAVHDELHEVRTGREGGRGWKSRRPYLSANAGARKRTRPLKPATLRRTRDRAAPERRQTIAATLLFKTTDTTRPEARCVGRSPGSLTGWSLVTGLEDVRARFHAHASVSGLLGIASDC